MGSSSISVPAGGATAPRRIAILGFAETVHDAPFSDPSWEMWGMNGLWRVLKEVPEKRFSAWFEIHTPEYIKRHSVLSKIGTQQLDWLKAEHPFPIYMQERMDDCPSTVAFPIGDLIEALGRDYFTSTVALLLAFALTQDPAEIGLWGIDLVHGTEWGEQRPCAEYWIGRAEAKGIKVTTHEKSALLKQRYRYGYDDRNPLIGQFREYLEQNAVVVKKKLAELHESNERAVAEMQTNDGALQQISNMLERLQIWERGGRL